MEEVRWLINSRAMYRMSNKVAGKDSHYWERQHDMDSSQVSFGVAFIAGLASFLSPCVLPLVPIYIAQLVGHSVYQATDGQEDRPARLNTFLHSLMFVLGFSLAFIAEHTPPPLLRPSLAWKTFSGCGDLFSHFGLRHITRHEQNWWVSLQACGSDLQVAVTDLTTDHMSLLP